MSTFRTLAIDPGYERLGTAIIEKDVVSKDHLIYSNCFKTSKDLPFIERLHALGDEIERLIEEFKPEYLAIENLFFNTNQKTAMHVAETRGAILYIAIANDLKVFEYTPLQIKSAVAGHGQAKKDDVIRMVRLLVNVGEGKKVDDEYDAIAVGLTHLASIRTLTL